MPAAALSDSGNISSSTVPNSSCATCLAIGYGSTVTLWDYSTGQTLVNFTHVNIKEEGKASSLDYDNYLFSDMEFSPNGQVIATSSFNSQTVFLSRASTGSLLTKIDVPSTEQPTAAADLGGTVSLGGVTSLNFGGGGRYMSFSTCYNNSGNGSSKVYIFNLAKMKWVRSFSVEPEFLCTKVCFDPSNNFLAALSTKSDEGTSSGASGANALTLWNVREGKIVISLHYPYRMPITHNNSYLAPPSIMRKLENRGAMQFSSLIPHYCAVGCGSSVLLYDLHRSTGVTSPFSSVSATNGSDFNSSTSSEPLLTLKDRHNGKE
jgi:hypothetical protein